MQIEKKEAGRSEQRTVQVAHPKGILGQITGWEMRFLNAGMNQASVEVLAPQSGDRILEIGFGPGDALARLTRQIQTGLIAGVDPSHAMFTQASRRNAQAINQGLVELHQGKILALPYPNATFDQVFAVNSFQFWLQPEHDLEKIADLLKPGGLLLIVVRIKDERSWLDFAGASLGGSFVERAIQSITKVGFQNVRTERRDAYPFPATCVSARKLPRVGT